MNRLPYTITKTVDDMGKNVWYCHHYKTPKIPVMGSIGNYKKAKSVCDTMNKPFKELKTKELEVIK